MIFRYILLATLCLGIVFTPESISASSNITAVAAAPYSPLTLFPTEVAARVHCPNDEVVWLNTATGIYHEKGMRWYGRTKNGAYVCRREADAAGDRDTRNGQ